MTELCYLADSEAAYERTFRATVVTLPPGAVVLDRTFFYPAGGGQPCDRGVFRLSSGAEVSVVDVTKSGPAVLHRLAKRSGPLSGVSAGTEIEGTIDWARRHRHMRSHTFQHLLSARLFARTSLRTRHARLDGSTGTVDLEAGLPPSETLESLAADVQGYLDRSLPVQIRHLARTEYEHDPGARSGLVPLPPQVDPVRVIEIEAADRCPCGGTHVRNTREIGPFELRAPTPLPEGGVRIGFRLADSGPTTPIS